MDPGRSFWSTGLSISSLVAFGYFCLFQALILFVFYLFRRDNLKIAGPGIIMLYSKTLVPSLIRSLARPIKKLKLLDKVIYYLTLFSMLVSWFVLLYTLELSFYQFKLPKTQRTPTVVPVIPGITIPFIALGSLVLMLVLHEFSHGILAEKYDVPVKSFGIIYFLCLPIGAYVEIDDKKILELEYTKQVNIFGVASLVNILSAFLVALVLRELVALGWIAPSQLSLLENSWVSAALWFVILSFSIAVINLLPIPGLDGYKILQAIENGVRSRLVKSLIKNIRALLLAAFTLTILLGIMLAIF